ncbi:transposase family protein [Streptosporangium lutulentum]
MPSSPVDVLTHHREHATFTDLITSPDDLPALAEVLDALPDPRSRRGCRYRLGSLLVLSLIAVLGGATSLAAITRCIGGYDPALLARAGPIGTVRLAATTLGRHYPRTPVVPPGRRRLRRRDLRLSGRSRRLLPAPRR